MIYSVILSKANSWGSFIRLRERTILSAHLLRPVRQVEQRWPTRCAPLLQVEALLDRMGERPPVMDFVLFELERLGYSVSYRVLETAGKGSDPPVMTPLPMN